MSGHTPGPWFVSGSMTKYVEARIGGGLIQEIAAVGPTYADSGYGDQQFANARLIAAAPDLLDALIDARQVISAALKNGAPDFFKSDEEVCKHSTVIKIDAAIAKATGDQT